MGPRSRPSKRVSAPRPQSETRPAPPAASSVIANEVPVRKSRDVTARERNVNRLPSPESAPDHGPGSSRSQSVSAASSACDLALSTFASAAASPASSPELSLSRPPDRDPPSHNGRASPARRASTPARGAARNRSSTASSTCSATVRPKRDSHAFGMWSLFSMVPFATASAMVAPTAFVSISHITSRPSSWASSSTATWTVLNVSPGANASVPEAAT